jgi:hypothetical protein
MRSPFARRTRIWLGVAAAAVVLCARAGAEPQGKKRQRAHLPRCAPAHIQDIRLPIPMAVDEVRVVVANHSPPSGAANVRVDAGQYDRVMQIHGQVSKTLQFHPALAGTVFHVSLDPVFEAPHAACIERVELVRRGVKVATIRP